MTRSKIFRISVLILLLAGSVFLYSSRFSPSARRANHLARGDRLYQSGEYDKAKLEYLVVLRKDATNRISIERLGNIWLLQGVPAKAMSFLLRLSSPSSLAAYIYGN